MKESLSSVLLFLGLSLVACDQESAPMVEVSESSKEVTVEDPADRGETPGETLFAKVSSEESGVDFINVVDESHPLARLYFSGFACGGAVMADFDGDGTKDLFFAGGAGKNGLYLQSKGRLKFEEVTEGAGVSGGDAWSAGALAADLDGDGDQDLVVANYESPANVFINDGTGKFTDRARDCGLTQMDSLLMPSVIDYDRDGDLDLFFVTNQLYREGGRPATPPFEKDAQGKVRVKKGFEKYFGLKPNGSGGFKMDSIGRRDILLRNDSIGGLPKFTDVTSAAGLTKTGFGLSATWFDFNDDGWPDLHVGNDFSDPDRLYQNLGNGTFVDRAREALPHCAWFSMGADAADVDGDGLDDLFCADMAFTTHYKQKVGMGQMGSKKNLLLSISPLQVMRNHLFLNTGMGPFREAGQLAGIAKSDWTWGVKFADLDLDGRQDLFIANGAIRSFGHADHGTGDDHPSGMTLWEIWKDTPSQPEANLAFRNLGEVKFEKSAKAWGLDEIGVSHGLACGDLDGDGDPDLVVTNLEKTVSIFENRSAQESITIILAGKGKNTAGVGARIEVESDGMKQSRTLRPASGYHTTSPAEAIFGLGPDSLAKVKVTWPDGGVQEVEGLTASRRYVIRERSKNPAKEKKNPPIFDLPKVVKGVRHREVFFDDFSKQPLLPHKLSQLGRATSWGDIDGDGDVDLFHGNARDKAGQLFKNDGMGNLMKVGCKALDLDARYEDAASLFFDADGDGDPDLYVASGSYEDDEGSAVLRDRLYQNDGEGNFTLVRGLPDLLDVGSTVNSSDVDGDGDLDLFIGSRVIPGKYPLPATSRLLLNETKNGQIKFVERSGAFSKVGMVSDAVWADIDGDGDEDLLVTQEWGAVKVFKNDAGKLSETTSNDSPLGWWTRIERADVDGDGDLDFAVGNFGLNTKYHASKEHPALIYYGDVVGAGTQSIVEAEFENGTLFPIRGKSCSTNAMPQLAKRFGSFHAFAKTELSEIYPGGLEKAQKFVCDTLESGFLINDGSGKFSFRAFPRIAQIAPVQGFSFSDFNGDGNLDLAMVQNFYNPQFETGPYAGAVGLLMVGDGEGSFAPVEPRESGILLRSDPRGLEAVDLDGDGVLDLVCPLNHAPLLWQKGNSLKK